MTTTLDNAVSSVWQQTEWIVTLWYRKCYFICNGFQSGENWQGATLRTV